MIENPELIAHHEAAHAVVTYLLTESAGGTVSIIADDGKGTLGHASDVTSDSMSQDHVESFIVSCFAGGEGQRRFDRSVGSDGCGSDEEVAADLMAEWGIQDRESEFRARAASLVEDNWQAITAVAAELIRCKVLDCSEVELIIDEAMGVQGVEGGLQHYRLITGETLERWRQDVVSRGMGGASS